MQMLRKLALIVFSINNIWNFTLMDSSSPLNMQILSVSNMINRLSLCLLIIKIRVWSHDKRKLQLNLININDQ